MNLIQKEFSYSEYYEEQREYTGEVKKANKIKKENWLVEQGKNSKTLDKNFYQARDTIGLSKLKSSINLARKDGKDLGKVATNSIKGKFYKLPDTRSEDIYRHEARVGLKDTKSTAESAKKIWNKNLFAKNSNSPLKVLDRKIEKANKPSLSKSISRLVDDAGRDLKDVKSAARSKAMEMTKEVSKGFKDARDGARGLIETKAKDTAKSLGSKLKGIAKFIKR